MWPGSQSWITGSAVQKQGTSSSSILAEPFSLSHKQVCTTAMSSPFSIVHAKETSMDNARFFAFCFGLEV